ncbi:MAG: hypothetical protein V1701_10450 [Planctomycetota bacterium]
MKLQPTIPGSPSAVNDKGVLQPRIPSSNSGAKGAIKLLEYNSLPLKLPEYNPGTLTYSTTYYWRIDSKNAVGTTQGTVWSFTTIVSLPVPVTSPNPVDGATDISITQQLSWLAATSATSYDVYFGTTSPGTLQGNQAGTSYSSAVSDKGALQLTIPGSNSLPLKLPEYNPGILTYSTTYYWRIDSKNSAGTTQGAVWSFTTGVEPVTPPDQVTSLTPANSATNISISQQLSWASAARAASYDVYFGTTNPPPSITNTATASYDPGTLNYGTTYYWRIDSKNAVGTTQGTVWSFTTASWVYTTLDSTGQVGEYTSIAIDSTNKAHISYYDETNGDLKYTTNASGSWVCSTLDSTDDVGRYASIALDSTNKAHISYRDYTNGDLKDATNASGSWVCSTLDSTDWVGWDTSIALDPDDDVHISYQDYTNGDLKYATNK